MDQRLGRYRAMREFPVTPNSRKLRIALMLTKARSDLFTAKIAKQRRPNKIFADYLRNSETASAVAAFSPRSPKTFSSAPRSSRRSWKPAPGAAAWGGGGKGDAAAPGRMIVPCRRRAAITCTRLSRRGDENRLRQVTPRRSCDFSPFGLFTPRPSGT